MFFLRQSLIFLSLLVIVGFGSCFGGSNDDGSADSGYVNPAEQTVVLSNESMSLLSAVESVDGAEFISFSGSTNELALLGNGAIIVGSPVAAAPAGFLREVVSVNSSGGFVVLETKKTTLDAAIEDCSIAIDKKVSETQVASFQPMMDGVSLSGAASGRKGQLDLPPLVINFNNAVIHDADDNEETTNDQITASGEITLDSDFEFDLDVKLFKVKKFLYKNTTKQTAKVQISSGDAVDASVFNFDKCWDVATVKFNPIIIPIGGFPIIITPTLIIKIGINGEMSVEAVVANISEEITLETGLIYENDEWSTINEFSFGLGLTVDELKGAASLRVYAGPQIELLFYDILGPYLFLKGYGKLTADGELSGSMDVASQASGGGDPYTTASGELSGNLDWALYGGVELDLGIKMVLFSKTIFDYSTPVFNWEKLIIDGSVNGQLSYNVDNQSDPVCTQDCTGTGSTDVSCTTVCN
ncbi:MAG: hypothetical protein GY754_34955 [bacterium]|nr:hypothetical protein [bacterium]